MYLALILAVPFAAAVQGTRPGLCSTEYENPEMYFENHKWPKEYLLHHPAETYLGVVNKQLYARLTFNRSVYTDAWQRTGPSPCGPSSIIEWNYNSISTSLEVNIDYFCTETGKGWNYKLYPTFGNTNTMILEACQNNGFGTEHYEWRLYLRRIEFYLEEESHSKVKSTEEISTSPDENTVAIARKIIISITAVIVIILFTIYIVKH